MQVSLDDLPALAARLTAERKRQGLSRTQAAAVCNVSPSFIRDAESAPERCTLGRLLQLVQGLGLTLAMTGWQDEAQGPGFGVPAIQTSTPAKDSAP